MLPQGVVVAILCNMQVSNFVVALVDLFLHRCLWQGVGLNQLAVDISKCFDGLDVEKPVKVQKIYQC